MLGEIDNLPDQLDSAYQLGMKHELPDWKDFRQVVIAGMGGSAIGADLLATYCAPLAPMPVSVHRDYGLPLFARGAETLVICSSHSGNTEETLDAFEAARAAGCRTIVVCTGGELARRARENNIPVGRLSMRVSRAPRWAFRLVCCLQCSNAWGSFPIKERPWTMPWLHESSQEHMKADIPAAKNPAKRYAGQLMGRWVTIVGSGFMPLLPAAGRDRSTRSPKQAQILNSCPRRITIPLPGQ